MHPYNQAQINYQGVVVDKRGPQVSDLSRCEGLVQCGQVTGDKVVNDGVTQKLEKIIEIR